jgi:hypothetical protein
MDAVEFLVDKCRSDCNRKDRNGATAKDLAIKKGHRKVEWFLRKATAATICHEIVDMGFQKVCTGRFVILMACNMK